MVRQGKASHSSGCRWQAIVANCVLVGAVHQDQATVYGALVRTQQLTATLPLAKITAVGALPAMVCPFREAFSSSCVTSSTPLVLSLPFRSRHGKLNESVCFAKSSTTEGVASLRLPLNAAVRADAFFLLMWRLFRRVQSSTG